MRLARRGCLMPGIHFVNTEHRSNFGKLLIQFGSYQDREYAAACYVLAHPESYRKVKWASYRVTV
ncbi:DUF2538 family protein [Paenibacillus mucilaginosus]|uniref:DUF2538 family protein n=1 Tax=Paenibacillus mucilaginosus TaxID=61624 RepID=UPI003D1DA321